MRILFSVPRYHTNFNGFAKGFIDGGHEVLFLTLSSGRTEHYYSGVHVQQIQKINLFHKLFGVKQPSTKYALPHLSILYQSIKKFKPDLIIVRGGSITSILVTLISKILDTKTIYYDQHPFGVPYARGFYHRLRLLGLLPAHRMTTVTATLTTKKMFSRNEFFIPFAMDVPAEAMTRAYNTSPPCRIMSVGKLYHSRKNSKLLIQALSPALREGRAVLTLVGTLNKPNDPVYLDLMRYIDECGVADMVSVISNLPYVECRNLYLTHDLFVLASSGEPAAISPLEAMAAGIPVICSSENGTNYIIRDGINGAIFEAGNLVELRRCAESFIENPEKRKTAGALALKLVYNNFIPEKVLARFLDCVKVGNENQLISAQEQRIKTSQTQAFWFGYGQGDGIEGSELANVCGEKEAVRSAIDAKNCEG